MEKVLDMREEEVMEIVDDMSHKPAAVVATDVDEDVTADDGEVAVEDEIDEPRRSRSRNAADAIIKSKSDAESKPDQAAVGDVEVDGDSTAVVAATENLVKSATQKFNHPERCRKVLERIWEDSFASSFIEPVDVDLYEDYLDVIETPMSLRDVKNKLDSGEYNKYMMYRRFAQDMRLIWQNCKNYNLYKSMIWHSAHALSLQFERLYQAWVLSFSDGLIGIDEPLGQPWQSPCCLCLNEENDDKLLLCDHCDAAFHIYCLRPSLPKVKAQP